MEVTEDGENWEKLEENVTESESVNSDCRMYELKRKSLSSIHLNHQILEEISEWNINFDNFRPKSEDGQFVTFKETAERFMEKIDILKSTGIYPHNNCYKACADRGCKWVIAFDGN